MRFCALFAVEPLQFKADAHFAVSGGRCESKLATGKTHFAILGCVDLKKKNAPGVNRRERRSVQQKKLIVR